MSMNNIKTIVTIKILSGPREGQLEKEVRSYAEADHLRVGDRFSEFEGDDRMMDRWEVVEIQHTSTITLTRNQARASLHSLDQAIRFAEDRLAESRVEVHRSTITRSLEVKKSLRNRIDGQLAFLTSRPVSGGGESLYMDMTAREISALRAALGLFGGGDLSVGFPTHKAGLDHMSAYLNIERLNIYRARNGKAVS